LSAVVGIVGLEFKASETIAEETKKRDRKQSTK